MPRSNSPEGRRKPEKPGAGRDRKRPSKRGFAADSDRPKRDGDNPRAAGRKYGHAQGAGNTSPGGSGRSSAKPSKPFSGRSTRPSRDSDGRKPSSTRVAKDTPHTGRRRSSLEKPSSPRKSSQPSRGSGDRKPPLRDRGDAKAHPFPAKRADDARPFKKFDRSGLKRGGKSLREEPPSQAPATGPVRLNKYIANSGVCSRREADELITMGLISVNGKVVTTLGFKVNPGDEVRHENKVLKAEKPVYILMNKPKGFLTTTSDPAERSTVMNLVGGVVKERIYPVGRLDRNTTGLLLLTNDGELAEKLMHPSYNVKKIYRVELDRPLTKADAVRITEGINLEEGRAIVDDLAVISEDKKTIGLEIHIGWNRVVRRIFEALDYQVVRLDRTAYAGLTKKDIGRGEWRFLSREEIVLLKHYK